MRYGPGEEEEALADYHHGDLENQITAACLADIRRHGELTLSIRGLTTKLGVSHNALYHHFKNKQALVAHLVDLGFGLLGKALADGPADSSLEAFGLRYFGFFRKEPQLYRFIFRHVGSEGGGEAKRSFSQLMARVGQSQDAAYHHWALVHGLCTLLSCDALRGLKLSDDDLEPRVLAILAAKGGTREHK